MALDLILYFGDIRCHLRGCYRFYFQDDPFGFRIEQLFGFLAIGLAFILGIVRIVRYLFPETVEDNNNIETRFRREFNNIIVVLAVLIMEFLLLIGFSCFGLIFSCISIIKRRFQPKVFDSEFEAFILTKDGNRIFKKFAKSEWSSENILFYESVEKLKGIPNKKYVEKRVNEIINTFIEIGSPLEVNLSVDARRETIKNVSNFKDFKENYDLMFELSIKETKRNMRDTFSRVRTSSEFKKWKKNTKVIINE